MKYFSWTWPALASLLFSSWSCTDDCIDGDRSYENGAVWTCSDGCNTCGCKDGQVTTTSAACIGPPGPAAGKLSCEDTNYWHRHGECWSCRDDGGDVCRCRDGRLTRSADACSAAESEPIERGPRPDAGARDE